MHVDLVGELSRRNEIPYTGMSAAPKMPPLIVTVWVPGDMGDKKAPRVMMLRAAAVR
jgi:hypothetical protein